MISVSRIDEAAFRRGTSLMVAPLLPPEGVDAAPFGSTRCIVEPGGASAPQDHLEPEVWLVTRGDGRVRVGASEAPVRTGDTVFIPAFTSHAIENTSETEPLEFVSLYWEDTSQLVAPSTDGEGTAGERVVWSSRPTPNGPLHVGHLAGPYLAADVYRRHRAARGDSVRHVTRVDTYNPYVVFSAVAEGSTPEAILADATASIERSLRAADVEVEGSLTAPPGADDATRALFRTLVGEGVLAEAPGAAAFCGSCDRSLADAEAVGECPHCGEPADGINCEACGLPHMVEETVGARCVTCDSAVEMRPAQRLVFEPMRQRAALDALHERITDPRVRAVYGWALERGLPPVPATQAGPWALPVEEGDADQGIASWFELAVMADEVGLGRAPDVVQFFGVDNAYYYAVVLPALQAARGLGGADTAVVSNDFYMLDGAKFSTSRRHAVWVEDAALEHSSDVLRAYVTRTRPAFGPTSYDAEALRAFAATELRGVWEAWLGAVRELADAAGGEAPEPAAWTTRQRDLYRQVLRAVADADAAYGAGTFAPGRALDAASTLVREAHASLSVAGLYERYPRNRTTELALQLVAAKAVATIAAPIMPRFGAALWRALGQGDTPIAWEDEPTFLPAGTTVALGAGPWFGPDAA